MFERLVKLVSAKLVDAVLSWVVEQLRELLDEDVVESVCDRLTANNCADCRDAVQGGGIWSTADVSLLLRMDQEDKRNGGDGIA